MMYTQTPEKLAQQQKLDRELAAVSVPKLERSYIGYSSQYEVRKEQ